VASVTGIVPAVVNVPLVFQLSPGTPPEAVQLLAFGADHVSSIDVPTGGASCDGEKLSGLPPTMPLMVSVPVDCGSSACCRVLVPVVLVVSAVEVQTAAREVKSATPLLPLGAAGGVTGQACEDRVGRQ
jgi:hypothetical protein